VRTPPRHRARRGCRRPRHARPPRSRVRSALFALVAALLVATTTAPVAVADCDGRAAGPVGTIVTATLADDGEVLDTEVVTRAGDETCAIGRSEDAAAALPVSVAVVHEAADGRSLEASELDDESDPVTTRIAVRDATAAEHTVAVPGPLGTQDTIVRIGVPQLVNLTLTYPASWQVTPPAQPGAGARLSGSGVEVVRGGVLFPPLTGEELRLEVTAVPGRGTPSIDVEVTPFDGDPALLSGDEVLDRDATAVLGALSLLAADGAVQLVDGLGQVADGADGLARGAGRLAAGTGALADGAGQLAGGTGELAGGAGQLADGLGASAAGARELASGSRQLADGTGQLATGFPELAAGARAIADGTAELAAQLDLAAGGAGELADGGAALAAGARELADGTAQLAAMAITIRDEILAVVPDLPLDLPLPALPQELLDDLLAELPEEVRDEVRAQLVEVLAQLEAELAAGIGSELEAPVAAALIQLQEISEVADRFVELAEGAAAIADGTAAIAEGNAGLADGLTRASEGTRQLTAGAAGLAGGIDEVDDGIRQLAAASEQLADGLAAFAAGSEQLAGAGAQLAGGARDAATGADELAAGTGELAGGAGRLASGANQLDDGMAELAGAASELPDGLQELVATADRAGQRSAATQAVLATGLELAAAAAGEADSLTTVLVHRGTDPAPWYVWALVALAVAAAAGSGWTAYRRRSIAMEAAA
jgi:X-X-X-Leu-X-X-Gly heptad repeat protein